MNPPQLQHPVRVPHPEAVLKIAPLRALPRLTNDCDAAGGAAHAARLGVLYLESFTELLHTLHLVPHVLSAAECNVLYRAVVRRKKVHQDRRMEHPEFVEAIRRIGAWRGERLWSLPTGVRPSPLAPPRRPRTGSARS